MGTAFLMGQNQNVINTPIQQENMYEWEVWSMEFPNNDEYLFSDGSGYPEGGDYLPEGDSPVKYNFLGATWEIERLTYYEDLSETIYITLNGNQEFNIDRHPQEQVWKILYINNPWIYKNQRISSVCILINRNGHFNIYGRTSSDYIFNPYTWTHINTVTSTNIYEYPFGDYKNGYYYKFLGLKTIE